jgi:hypothetical protein
VGSGGQKLTQNIGPGRFFLDFSRLAKCQNIHQAKEFNPTPSSSCWSPHYLTGMPESGGAA